MIKMIAQKMPKKPKTNNKSKYKLLKIPKIWKLKEMKNSKKRNQKATTRLTDNRHLISVLLFNPRLKMKALTRLISLGKYNFKITREIFSMTTTYSHLPWENLICWKFHRKRLRTMLEPKVLLKWPKKMDL